MFVELPCYDMKSDYNRFVMFVELPYDMKSDYNRFVMYQCLSNYLVTIWNLIIIGL